MTEQTMTCSQCQQPIDTGRGYLVAAGDDGLQFTYAADPKLQSHEEAMHFVCPDKAAR